jgi:hypothetical protein
MYNEEIENLINLALADGELTEKEKQILFKKAEAAGINLDEFEMVLEAKLFEKQKINKSSAAAPKSDKLGDVRKCPACGSITESFATRCSGCGTEFRNIEAAQSVVRFFDKLNELESGRTNVTVTSEKLSGNIGCSTIVKWMFLYPILLPYNAIIFLINKSKPPKWSTTDVKKEELIINFPVPNSREDIIEFITLSLSKIQTLNIIQRLSEEGKYTNKWNEIWKKKCEQIYSKAKLSMSDDQKTLRNLEELLTGAGVIKSNNKK